MVERTKHPEAADDRQQIDAVLRHGSSAAARALVEQYTPDLLTPVRRLLATDPADAEDVVQEAWVKAFAQLHTFRNEGPLRAWLLRIAVRCAYDHLRRRSGQRWMDSDDELAQIPAAETDRDLQFDLERLVARLPPGCRAVLVLHDIEGLTHEEIHANLGIAVGTSKAHLFRARNLLKSWLHNPLEADAP